MTLQTHSKLFHLITMAERRFQLFDLLGSDSAMCSQLIRNKQFADARCNRCDFECNKNDAMFSSRKIESLFFQSSNELHICDKMALVHSITHSD